MKFSWSYVKANPVMFGGIFIVFGLILWLVLNKGAGSSGNSVIYQSAGKDPNQVAAEAAIAQASIQANAQTQAGQLQLAAIQQQGQTELALAGVSGQIAMAELAVSERLGAQSLDQSLNALRLQLETEQNIVNSNNTFQVNYAKLSTDSATRSIEINANLQRDLGAQQLAAYQTGSILSVIPSLKKKDRDNALLAIVKPIQNGYTAPGLSGQIVVYRN